MSVGSFEDHNDSHFTHGNNFIQLQKIIDTSLDVICTIDEEGCFTWLNKATNTLWGYSPDELIGQQYLDYVLEPDREITRAVAENVTSGINTTDFENRYLHKDGHVVDVVWSATWSPSDKTLYCVARDATEKKLALQAVSDQHALLKKALRVARMGTWEFDVQTGSATWSEELYEIYGFEGSIAKDHLLEEFMKHIHPDDHSLVQKKFAIERGIQYSFVHRFVRPDGQLIYLRQSTSSILTEDGRITKITGIAQDVTETIESDEELRNRERRFKALVHSSWDMVGIIDLLGNYTYVSESVTSILGFSPQDLVGKNAFEFINPEDAERVHGHLAACALEKYVEIKPFRFLNASGEWRWIATRVTNLMGDPAVDGLVVNSRDVTLKKQIQDKNAELSTIAEQTNNAVIITNREGEITWVNPAFEKISGYYTAEVLGKKPGAFLQGPDSDLSVVAHMRECIKKGEGFDVEIINYSRKGEPYWMHIQCQPQVNESGGLSGFFAIQTDITERKRLQQQLQSEIGQRQKRITSAVLHAQEKERSELSKELHDNVNQILTTVKLYLEMVQDGRENAALLVSKAKEYVLDSINEIRSITKRLAAPEKVDVHLSEAVQELVDTISLSGKIQIDYKHYGLDMHQPTEEVSLAIFRVAQEHLTNIVKHAEANKVQVTLSVIAGNLSLLVSDNGKGFDTSKRRRGIGLNNMYNRVETFNGRLEINSKVGAGCTLMAVLPLTPKETIDQ